MIVIEDELPQLSIERLTKRYGSGRRRRWADEIYGAMLAEARQLAGPGSIYGEFSLDEVQELAPWLPEATNAVVMGLCTLGPGPEARVNELFPDDPAAAVVLDEICLALVSAMARDLHQTVRRQAEARGLHAGPPFRPGLGKWPLETQRVLFAHLPAHQIGVSLGEYLVMTPAKTTSLLIPLLTERTRWR